MSHCRRLFEEQRNRIEKLTKGEVVSIHETDDYVEFTVRLKKA